MRSIILSGLWVLLMTGVCFPRACIETSGNTDKGESVHVIYCLSYDQPSADKGVYKLDMRGGTFYKNQDVVFVNKYFGSNSVPIGLREQGTGFVLLSDHLGMFYIFYSEIMDAEMFGLGSTYRAFIYVFEPTENGINLVGWWYTVYASVLDLLANDWLWLELPQPITFNYFEG